MRRRAGVVLAAALLSLLGLAAGAAPADRIVIGVPTTLTLLEGAESLNAVKLAVEEINAGGGVQVGRARLPIRIEPLDLRDAETGVKVADALATLEKFLDEKSLNAIVVGPFRSEVLLGGMDAICRRRLPLLGTIAMTPATEALVLKNPRYKYIFRVGLDAKYLVDRLIHNMKFLREKFGFSRVFILNQDVAWARSSASLIMKLYLYKKGWNVLGQVNYPGEAADFAAGLEKAKALGAQVILCIFDAPQSGGLVRQWRRMEIPAFLSGFISPMTGPGAWRAFDGRISGTVNVIFELGNIPSRKYPPAADFYDAYRRRFGREIEAGHGPAPSYEAVYILAEAITRAGSLDPDLIVAELEKTDRVGAMGRVRFHKGHQAIFGDDPQQEALACLMQWTADGRRRIVYPPSLAEGEIELPVFLQPLNRLPN
ncbi:MAG: ABC transporter substrate-binding protein [Pseudomonadota bacterium]